MAKRTNRVAWGLVAILATVLLGGVGVLGVRLRPYWVAKYRGENADLHCAFLVGAPLAHAQLGETDLRGANLAHADLSAATLCGANLTGAELTGAILHGATLAFTQLRYVDLRRADLRGAKIYNTTLAGADLRGADLRGAWIGSFDYRRAVDPGWFVGTRFDAHTHWPTGFDPIKHYWHPIQPREIHWSTAPSRSSRL